jgi:hypothetical protein
MEDVLCPYVTVLGIERELMRLLPPLMEVSAKLFCQEHD